MARIRTIKPEFWTSEQVVECSPNSRLLFIGLWNFCDDSGVHPANTRRLQMEIFPGGDFTINQIIEMIEELISHSLLKQYEVNGEPFWIVTGWKHQRIDQPTFRHPLPDGLIPQPKSRRRPSSNSTGIRRTVEKCSPPEGKGGESIGKESIGVEGNKEINARSTPLPKDFVLSGNIKKWLKNKSGFEGNIQWELAQFRDKATAEGWKAKDWDAKFRTWIRNRVKWDSEKKMTDRDFDPFQGAI